LLLAVTGCGAEQLQLRKAVLSVRDWRGIQNAAKQERDIKQQNYCE